MATQAQTAANRRPSPGRTQRSTGPRTPEGKARSSQNALKHGVRAQAILSAQFELLGESSEEFASLLQALVDDLQPLGPLEETCVETIALGLRRQRRIIRGEMGFIDRRQISLRDRTDAAALARVGLPEFDVLGNLMRYENHLTRQIWWSLNKLTQLQGLRYLKARQDALDQRAKVDHKTDMLGTILSRIAARGAIRPAATTEQPPDDAQSPTAAAQPAPRPRRRNNQTKPIPLQVGTAPKSVASTLPQHQPPIELHPTAYDELDDSAERTQKLPNQPDPVASPRESDALRPAPRRQLPKQHDSAERTQTLPNQPDAPAAPRESVALRPAPRPALSRQPNPPEQPNPPALAHTPPTDAAVEDALALPHAAVAAIIPRTVDQPPRPNNSATTRPFTTVDGHHNFAERINHQTRFTTSNEKHSTAQTNPNTS